MFFQHYIFSHNYDSRVSKNQKQLNFGKGTRLKKNENI